MEKEISVLIKLHKSPISKLYIYLKYLLTPFKVIDRSLPSRGNILDVGCGSGMYSIYLYLRSENRSIKGIDGNKNRIEYANKLTKNINQLSFDWVDLNMDYRIEKYDSYLINDVLHHIPNKSKRKLISTIYKSMDSDGSLVIKEIDSKNRFKFFLNYINDKIMTKNDKLYFMKRTKLIKILKNVGFKVTFQEIRGFLFPHLLIIARK